MLPTRSWALAGLLCLALAGEFGRVAYAQVAAPPELPGAVEPGRNRPLPPPPAQTPFDFTIEAPNRSQVPRSVQELHFTLTDIHIEGAVTLPTENFRPLYQGLIGKEITVTAILDVADAIEDQYRRAGYVLTHAFVPPQRVRNGEFTIEVVEGYVASIAIEGGDPGIQALIRNYLRPVLESHPLEIATMERALLLANDVPGITASGLLRPSPDTPGAADLVVTVVQSHLNGGFAVNNRDSEFTDHWLMTGDLEANSLAMAGDQLGLSLASARNALEKLEGQERYRLPLGQQGTVASLIATETFGEPSGSILATQHIITDSYAVGPRVSYPILRSRVASLVIDGGFTAQDARARAPGVLISHDQWRVADASIGFSGTSFLGSTASTLDLAQGLGILGASRNGETMNGVPVLSRSGNTTGNPEFTKVLVFLRHSREIVGPLSFVVMVQAQYAFAPLLAGEQITFGGTQIGRGYDPAAIAGDHGVGGAGELRYDERLEKYGIEDLEPYVFFDTGKVWNRKGGAPSLTVTAAGVTGTGSGLAVASTGLGLRAFFAHNITAGIEFAQTLKPVPGSDLGRTASKIFLDAGLRF